MDNVLQMLHVTNGRGKGYIHDMTVYYVYTCTNCTFRYIPVAYILYLI